jgi:hypothetical protein
MTAPSAPGVVYEPFNAADVLDAVGRPDVLGALAQQVERFLASHALPGSCQVLQLERNFAAGESIDEEDLCAGRQREDRNSGRSIRESSA